MIHIPRQKDGRTALSCSINHLSLDLTATDSSIHLLDVREGSSVIDLTDTDVTLGLVGVSQDVDFTMNGGTFGGGWSTGNGKVNAEFSDVTFTNTFFSFGSGGQTVSFANSSFVPNSNLQFGNGNNTIKNSGDTVFGAESQISASNGIDLLVLPEGSIISYNGTDYVVGTDTLPSNWSMSGSVELPNGSDFSFQQIDSFQSSGPVCFAQGTRILTTRGERLVDDLAAGDRLIEHGGGSLKILWIGKTDITFCPHNDKHRPIEFKAGSLGSNMPNTPLVVSPFPRIMRDLQLPGGAREQVLCHAKGLSSMPGVRVKRGVMKVTYYSILLERHGIIQANEVTCKSFFPGSWALTCLEFRARQQLSVVIGNLDRPYGLGARRLMTVGESRKAIAQLHPPKCSSKRQSAPSARKMFA